MCGVSYVGRCEKVEEARDGEEQTVWGSKERDRRDSFPCAYSHSSSVRLCSELNAKVSKLTMLMLTCIGQIEILTVGCQSFYISSCRECWSVPNFRAILPTVFMTFHLKNVNQIYWDTSSEYLYQILWQSVQ